MSFASKLYNARYNLRHSPTLRGLYIATLALMGLGILAVTQLPFPLLLALDLALTMAIGLALTTGVPQWIWGEWKRQVALEVISATQPRVELVDTIKPPEPVSKKDRLAQQVEVRWRAAREGIRSMSVGVDQKQRFRGIVDWTKKDALETLERIYNPDTAWPYPDSKGLAWASFYNRINELKAYRECRPEIEDEVVVIPH